MTPLCNVIGEVWKPVTDFSDYEVSDHGRLKSYANMGIVRKIMGNGRILSPALNNHGYAICHIYENGKGFMKYIHRLVLESHVGKSLDSDNLVHHKDGDKLNNNLSNLEWANYSSNALYARDDSGGRVLEIREVRRIKEMIKAQVKNRTICEMFCISEALVSGIKHGTRWAGIGD